jgi:metal-responsive CopG/Arc/MetJ family transcriptional regulator
MQMGVSLSDWVVKKIDQTAGKNRSKRIEELVLKGLMVEQEERIRSEFITNPNAKNVESGILTRESYITPLINQGRGIN